MVYATNKNNFSSQCTINWIDNEKILSVGATTTTKAPFGVIYISNKWFEFIQYR